jgi:hypothetical protein
MFCEDSQESDLVGALSGTPTIEQTVETLTLSYVDGHSLRFVSTAPDVVTE